MEKFGLARLSSVLFYLISRLLLLSLAEEETRYKPRSPSFDCGKLLSISLPFSNVTDPDCGLLKLEDCNKPVQKIRFGKDGPSFNILNIYQDDTVLLQDQVFQKHLKHNSCESFKNFTLPISRFMSFKITSLLTLFKCPSTHVNITTKFSFHCDYSIVYYNNPNDDLTNFPSQCSLVQLPVNKTTNISDSSPWLTGVFFLQLLPNWQAIGKCKECRRGGGKYGWDRKGKLHCSNRRTGKWGRLGLGLDIGLGGFMVIVVVSIFVIRHRKKQYYTSTSFNSRYKSSDPSSKSELEVGSFYFGVPIFSYSELAAATNNFNHEKRLGDGGFGTVYYGKLRAGREVAVKRLYEHNYRRVEQFMNEVKILTGLSHENLVSLFGCTSRHCQQGLLLVYEYVPNGTVADHLYGSRAQPGSLTWSIRMNIAIETASALAYLHASDIIHRDVKTNNILLDNNFCVKVADFGLSRLFPNDVTHVSTAPQGSPGYVDPEYHQCYQLTDKSDVYSFGVILIELISSLPAVDTSRHKDEINLANLALKKIQKCAIEELVDPNLGYQSDEEVKRMTTAVAELAFICLQQIKEMRPSMDAVLKELKRIESGESKLENLKEEKDNNDELKSMQPLPSQVLDYDNIALLKHMRVSSSPISVSEDWVSSNSTWSTSNVSS